MTDIVSSLCNTLEQFSAIAEDHGEERFLISFDVDEVNELLHHLYRLENIVDKYRWHDLRKDPDDLPAFRDNGFGNCGVLVANDNPNYQWVENFPEDTIYGKWYQLDDGSYFRDGDYQAHVVAWRYMEPFEVSE